MYINNYLEQTDSKYFIKRYKRHIFRYRDKTLNRALYKAPYLSPGYDKKLDGVLYLNRTLY